MVYRIYKSNNRSLRTGPQKYQSPTSKACYIAKTFRRPRLKRQSRFSLHFNHISYHLYYSFWSTNLISILGILPFNFVERSVSTYLRVSFCLATKNSLAIRNDESSRDPKGVRLLSACKDTQVLSTSKCFISLYLIAVYIHEPLFSLLP